MRLDCRSICSSRPPRLNLSLSLSGLYCSTLRMCSNSGVEGDECIWCNSHSAVAWMQPETAMNLVTDQLATKDTARFGRASESPKYLPGTSVNFGHTAGNARPSRAPSTWKVADPARHLPFQNTIPDGRLVSLSLYLTAPPGSPSLSRQ